MDTSQTYTTDTTFTTYDIVGMITFWRSEVKVSGSQKVKFYDSAHVHIFSTLSEWIAKLTPEILHL